MCGFFGHFEIGALESADLSHQHAATQSLKHRGPDGGAYFRDANIYLGHRRLSIIDLDSRSQQPMLSGDLCMVFNGEIYNYLELKNELESAGVAFKTRSDTEVLLEGYRRGGIDFVKRLEGMFAFAIYDQRKKSLTLGRDPFGEKPLFYAYGNGRLFFGSEIKIFQHLPVFDLQICEEHLDEYLFRGFTSGDRTLLKGVKKVRPGHCLRFEDGEIVEVPVWKPPQPLGNQLDPEEVMTRVEVALERSVSLVCRSDVPVCLFLSGGIDSSIVAKLATERGRVTDAFCLDFDEGSYSEFAGAKRVADKLGLRLRRVPLRQDVLFELPDIIEFGDDPIADSSQLCVWTIAREAAKEYKVALSGDGGDEVFGGYLTYKATLLHQKFIQSLPNALRLSMSEVCSMLPISESKVSFSYKMMRFLRGSALNGIQAHRSWNGMWLPHEIKKLTNFDRVADHRPASLRKLNLHDLQVEDMASYLPNDILTKVDRMTMAHGLESRTPFLNPALVDMALSLPLSNRIMSGRLKAPLRDLAKKYYGAETSEAPKQGFSIPIHSWLRSSVGRSLIGDFLVSSNLESLPFLNAKQVGKEVDLFLGGKNQRGHEIFSLLALAIWWRKMRDLSRVPRAGTVVLERTMSL